MSLTKSKQFLPIPFVEDSIHYSYDEWKYYYSDKINEIINISINHLKNTENNKILIQSTKQLSDEITKLLYKTSINTRKKYKTY